MCKLYCGDNLEIMHGMPDASIDLIATDPPFNTGRDWIQFNDKWGSMDKYLKFMELRLEEMHRLLKPTGSFYLHCDPTASHYLKVMLDGVFGIKQFRNEIVWKRQLGRSNNAKLYGKEHDILLFYTRSDAYVFNPVYKPLTAEQIKAYKHTDENGRKFYTDSGNRKRETKVRRFYLDESKGIALDTLWTKDCQLASSSKERLGYPTQKPVALYERIIKASSNAGDTVLDPFCGSGTTLEAAGTLGRRWIGIDQNPEAIAICKKRLNPIQQKLFDG